MMATPLPTTEAISKAIVRGDLSLLTAQERQAYYLSLCDLYGINPAVRPFDFIEANNNGKKTLIIYANDRCATALRTIHNVSLHDLTVTIDEQLVMAQVNATLPNGRTEPDVGVLSVKGILGQGKADAIMKAVTKAKRRATLRICGLGMLDQTEIEDSIMTPPHRLLDHPPNSPIGGNHDGKPKVPTDHR